MRVLVFGGTRFVGRHVVGTLAARGHDVTCFHRGQNSCELPSGVREILGDRNEALPASLREPWDAIVDVSGQRPDQLARSVDLHAGWYLFVSTLNVYADLSKPNVNEESPTIIEFDPGDEAMAYGGNKAACERLVRDRFGGSATILRPGIIVGRWDYTGRFSFWPRRALRGGRFVVPGPASRPVQFADARDLAAFAALAITQGISGAFNVAGPREPLNIGELARTCVAGAAERGIATEGVPISSETLIAARIEPWTDIPMWLEDPEFAGLFEVSHEKAVNAGLTHRSALDTVRALMGWLSEPESDLAAKPGLSEQREAELLQEFAC
ncbi:MAG TPA: NAD-dependent epimerase/dehydratase family protein [Candidatus Cybelea sp.]|nr:NAD-dependent epimerase/dehydratase family protein [Candidatus Cybelea sp.]